jgi:hypothetical protein
LSVVFCGSSDAARREEGLAIVRALAVKSSSALDVVSAGVDLVVDVLNGKKGKLTQVYQRQGMYATLAATAAVQGECTPPWPPPSPYKVSVRHPGRHRRRTR